MSAPPSTVAPSTFEPPGADGGLLISRSAEADRITTFITTKKARFMVLCGAEESGKTVLITHWLLPALRKATAGDGYSVFYGQCNRLMPEVLSGVDGQTAPFVDLITRKTILVVDEFDWVLDLPRDERRSQIEGLFEKLGRANPEAIVVVVVSQRHLTSMYALSSYDSGIVNAVCEIRPVGLADGLEQLSDEDPDTSLTYTPELLNTLRDESKDLAQKGIDVTFDLLKLLHTRFARAARETGVRQIDVAQYSAIGGLTGVLREHVDHQLDTLETARAGSDKLARAILERVLETHTRGSNADFDEIARRYEVSDDEVRSVVAGLTAPGNLLIESPPGQYQFQPPQIVAIVQEDSALRQMQRERATRIVEEGLRSRQQLGTFLPSARFAEIHKQRRYLILDDELIRFLVQCALRDSAAESGAAEYWLRRVTSPDDAMDILLAAAFDTSADVRARAAVLLGEFQEPLVRDRLCVLALTDPAPAVRSASIQGLARMADDELLAHLLLEVHSTTAVHRKEAIDALRIFPRKEVATVLRELVRGPATEFAIREKSVAVLAALNIGDSVDALVDIALNDPDVEDRTAASKALACADTLDLNRRILSQLDWRKPTKRMWAAGALMALGLIGGMVVTLVLLGGPRFGRPLILAPTLLALSAVSGFLLVRLSDGRLKWRSPVGVTAVALFALSAITVLPVLHGLGHIMVGRIRRGLALLGYEALGIICFFPLAGATEFVPGLRVIANGYRIAGVLLFVGSYFYDVLAVALTTIVFRRTMAREEQRKSILRKAFHNPAMVDAVFANLRSTVAAESRRAKHLIKAFGRRMSPTKLMEMLTVEDSVAQPYVVEALADAKDDDAITKLEVMWSTAWPTQQLRIAAVLAENPTSHSIEALEHVGAKTGAVVKLRATLARLRFTLAVWPWQAYVAVLLLLPAIGVLSYHGTKIRKNPAWAEIITLRQAIQDVSQKAKIVDFLVDAYPVESRDQLRDLFRDRRKLPPDSLLSALVRGLVTLENKHLAFDTLRLRGAALAQASDSLHEQLEAEMVRFDSLLWHANLGQFLNGVGVLRAMAADTVDPVVASQALDFLSRFVGTDTGKYKYMAARQRPALRAIGNSPSYARTLPILDTLLRRRRFDKLQSGDTAAADIADLVRDQIVRVARQAYSSIPERNGADARKKLLATLNSLSVPVAEVTALKTQLVSANRLVADCKGTSGDKCAALTAIAEDPMSEDAYRDLLGHYTASKQYEEATAEFTRLKDSADASIWPRKMLAELYHENRSAESSEFFERAYTEMVGIRKLPAFKKMQDSAHADYVRVQADFVETALTARKYAEAETAARELLADTSASVDRLNMRLFLYIAAVMKPDAAAAQTRLAELNQLVKTLPAGYYNNWIYPGTLVFIDKSALSASLKKALSSLCKSGQWPTQLEAADIIAANEAALKTLTAQGGY